MFCVRNGFIKAKQLVQGGLLHILAGNVLNRAISMISGIIIARFVDKAEYAKLSYADNIYSYIALFSGLGLSSAILRYCAVQTSKEKEKAYLNYAFRCGGAFDLLISFLACIALMIIDIPYPRSRVYMWALMFYPLISHINTCLICYLRTQLENKKYALNGVINSAVLCLASIVLVVLFGTAGVVPSRYIAIGAATLYAYLYYRKRLKGITADKLSHDEKKAFLAMGLSLMVASFFSGIMPINETFLVNNIIRDEVTTANFRVAGQLPQLLQLISGAVTVYYFPIIARMKECDRIKKTVIKVGILNGFIVGFAAAVGMLLTPLAMDILYGGKYNDSINISYLLWIMRATNGCLRIVPLNMLAAIGKTKFNAILSVISCVIQTLLDYAFISSYGVMGVAYGTIIVYALSSILYWGYFILVCNKSIKNCGGGI